jgi:hypothetical protein
VLVSPDIVPALSQIAAALRTAGFAGLLQGRLPRRTVVNAEHRIALPENDVQYCAQ